MMRDGVGGLFLKEQPLETLLEAIRTVAEGRVWFDPRQFRELLVTPEAHDIFDERERIILRGIVKGLSNKEIANRLNVPETTVKSGVQRLFEKTGVRTRGSLVRVAFEKYRHLVE
jgi:two-component system nitrate/nitrite response regulator NarL